MSSIYRMRASTALRGTFAERIEMCDQHIDAQLAPAEAGSEVLIGDGFDGICHRQCRVRAVTGWKPAIEFVRESAPIMALAGRRGCLGVVRSARSTSTVRSPNQRKSQEVRRLVNVQDHVVFAGSFDPKTADLAVRRVRARHVAARFMRVGDF